MCFISEIQGLGDKLARWGMAQFLSSFFQKISPCKQSPEVCFLCSSRLKQMSLYRLIKPFCYNSSWVSVHPAGTEWDWLNNSNLKGNKLRFYLLPMCQGYWSTLAALSESASSTLNLRSSSETLPGYPSRTDRAYSWAWQIFLGLPPHFLTLFSLLDLCY